MSFSSGAKSGPNRNLVQDIKEINCTIETLIRKINKSCPECVGKLSLSFKGNMLRLKHGAEIISQTPLPTENIDIQFRVVGNILQYQINGGSWINIFDLATLNGREVEMSAVDGYIVWRYVGETIWTNLVDLDDLRGNDGKSAYDIWIEQGNTGSQQDFLNSLKGDTTNVFYFDSPSENWFVPHNLNKYPITQVIIDGKDIVKSIDHVDLDSFFVRHSKPEIGYVTVI